MAKPYEQEVILDADGKSLFNAMEAIERRLNGIQKVITNIHNESFKSAKDFSTTLDVNIKALQRAMAQMRALNNIGATERRQQLALAKSQAERDKSRYGDSARARYQYDLEQKILKLRYAANEEERLAGLNAVRLAEARLRALNQIEQAERRITNESRRRTGADELTAHRQQLALSRQYARTQADALGASEALARQKAVVLSMEQKLNSASITQANHLRRNLELENARLRALERITAQEQRLAGVRTAGGGGGSTRGPESRIGTILSPGYAGAAFARTSVYGAAAALAYGLFNAVTQAATGVVTLEDALFKLQAISNSTDTQMQTLKSTIYSLGKESRFSLQELAEAATILAQAGVSAGQMESVLRSVTTLATASGSTIDEAAQLVTSAIGSFQLQASEAGRVADLMVNALNRTKLTVQQTGQAIQYVGATAFEQNISLEQLLATIGAVAQAGVRSGSTIGTGFRQFLVDLADPSKNLTEQLTLLGLKTSDVNVAVRGLPAVLDTLSKAGFGAAQAYAGLEVRAAAFYLIAKNNVEIMDQLQLAFAQQGASATANERAMSSLSAQWQRFKNILQAGLASGLEDTMAVLRDIIRKIADRMIEMQAAAQALQERQERGRSAYGPGLAGAGQFALEYDIGKNILSPALERLLNGQFMPGYNGAGLFGNFGTELRKLGQDANSASAASERLATRIAEANDKITQQRGSIAELDKELLRLITQKESLRNNEVRTATETATLSSRFKGLALQLTTTGNSYDSLVEAMKRYRNQQLALLSGDLLAQESNLTLQTAQKRTTAVAQINNLLGNQQFTQAVGPQVSQALRTAQSAAPGSREFLRAMAVLTDAVNRFSANQPTQHLAQQINNVVATLGTISSNTAELTSIRLQNADALSAQTEVGQFITNNMRDVEAMIAQLSAMSNEEKGKGSLANRALGNLATLDSKIEEVLNRSLTENSRRWLGNAKVEIGALRQQIKASMAPTSDEKRDAAKAEREAEKGPPLTQQQLDDIAKRFLGAGFSLGSGVRSAGEQNRLHALGLTPATAGTSAHSNGGLARDFRIGPEISDAQAKQLATGLRQHFKNLGVDVFVQFETGRGRNQGSGRHIHASARRGTRWKGSAAGSDAAAMDQFAAEMDAAQLGLDKREFNEALKDLSKVTTAEAIDAALTRAREAMKKVNNSLARDAMNDLAKAGVGPGMPQYQERINQLKDQIDQNAEEFNRKLVEAIVKGSQQILKAAQEAFERALAPSERRLALAEGTASGLNYASLQGRVPDYTKQLADMQAARAREAVDRARLQALPARIAAEQANLNNLLNQRQAGNLDDGSLATLNQQILTIENSLANLIDTRDALAAAFGAEGLIPKTFGEGLQQAMEAYSQLNGLNRDFVQMVNGELTGAISAVHQGLTTMFEGVFTGSLTAGQAILGFAKSIISAIGQIVAKIIATQIIKLLFQLFGVAIGGGVGGDMGASGISSAGGNVGAGGWAPGFHGGYVKRQRGGPINRGHGMRDNVLGLLARGEWVINKRAADSVGHEFMSDLNARGAQALNNTQSSMPAINLKPEQKVNVWVVKPEEKPQMGPNDVLVTWQNDVLQGGQTRRLVETIVRDTK
jgi:TP901 family phage tail tape measure protein